MANYTFTFTNSNDGQTFTVLDQLDLSKNPIFFGAINHNDVSQGISCWVGDNSKGQVSIQGEHGPLISYDVSYDGELLEY